MVFGDAAGAVSQLIQEHATARGHPTAPVSARGARGSSGPWVETTNFLKLLCDASHLHRLELSVDQTRVEQTLSKFWPGGAELGPSQETQEQMLHAIANVHSAPELVA